MYAQAGRLDVVYFGTNEAVIDAAGLQAKIFSPNAKVSFQKSFRGTVFSREIEVRPDVVLQCED